MECRIGEASVHYVDHGAGVPVVVLHGAGVDHREIEAALEPAIPLAGFRRIYPDLPGYPRANLAVIEGAGHALLHERPELIGALLRDWLDRAKPTTRI